MTFTLSDAQRAFLTAALDTLIPADDLSPSASECGGVDFIERQLAGPYGDGARLYRNAPFLKGKPEHGYQLALTPRELIVAGIAAADAWTGSMYGRTFASLSEPDRVAALQAMEAGTVELVGVPPKEFFDTLLSLAAEGFFADPIHGGNRGCASWRMIGYPGQPANYRDAVARMSGKRLDLPPHGIADIE